MDFTELQYSEQDSILSAKETEDETPFDPIELDKVIYNQLTDPFCVEVRRKLNEGRRSAFEVDYEGVVVQSSDKGVQIVAPHSMKDRILHINHHSLRAAHP